jgi:methylenetetrahydrofolate/methylenetetrahydromethanopterin dehydrogenase (NADP+)
MPKRVLIQLDGDPQPSTFDAVVAVDAGAEVLLRHGGVTPDHAVPLVRGAMFTRGGGDLASTAIFVGGSDVAAAEAVATRVAATFFGPVRVGVLVDPSGANTTAAAAVVSAGRHLNLTSDLAAPVSTVVLGGTGPVGQRVVRLLAAKGVQVAVASRSLARAEATVAAVRSRIPAARLTALESPAGFSSQSPFGRAVAGADLIVAAGAAGATLLDHGGRAAAGRARVLIDLNAVPPAGITGVEPQDKARADGAAVCYGPFGIGGLKMKIHRAAIERIFTDTQAFLDAEDLLAIGESLG